MRFPRLEGARVLYRWLRKRFRRLRARASTLNMRLRNRFVRSSVTGAAPAVVSLTSFDARIADVALAIESIARGEVKPERLILWLDTQADIDAIPEPLKRLRERGLEVLVGGNFGPHKKYYPYLLSKADHDYPLVTADDDVVYPSYWLKNLLAASDESPDTVCCYRGNVLQVDDGIIKPYNSWPRLKSALPSQLNFATGVSGILYPIRMLAELSRRGDSFLDSCPFGDDIWMHWVAFQIGVKVKQVSDVPKHFPAIPGTQNSGLVVDNVGLGRNDTYIRNLYTTHDIARLSSSE